MSDRFVSGGTIGAGNEITAPSGSDAETTAALTGKHNAEWEAVQKELEAERQKREDERRKAAEGGERSLYDILEANKGKESLLPRKLAFLVPSPRLILLVPVPSTLGNHHQLTRDHHT